MKIDRAGCAASVAAALATTLVLPALALAGGISVDNMAPTGGFSSSIPHGDPGGLAVAVNVNSPGVTDGPGAGAGIQCWLRWGRAGQNQTDLAMTYSGDAGNDDRYGAQLPTAALAPGNHSFTAWCSDDGGATPVFRNGPDGILAVTPAPEPPPGNALVQLFEWKWTDIAQECVFLAEKGYTAAQVPPPNEHLSHLTAGGNPWWVRYQPMGFTLESRSGTPAEFSDMVAACNAAGIDIYVDAVINHMTNAGFGNVGTAGTFYFGNSYNYPGSFGPGDFHYCGTDSGGSQQHDLFDFSDRFQSHNCELFGLADVDTGATSARAMIVAYLQHLLDLGVAGFRIDAAKHIASSDLEAIFATLTPAPYIYQEVIDSPSEQVRFWEYLVHGDVAEFGYGATVGNAFSGCGSSVSDLQNLDAGLFGSDDSVVFTDNHDTQRQGGCIVSHQDGTIYDLANVFMLAHPYGFPRVMSSYAFGNNDAGPPATGGVTDDIWVGGEPVGCNGGTWVCEHRRPAIANLVTLRGVAAGEPLAHWWDDNGDRIAFGRGDKAYVAINRAASPVTRTFQTGLPAGTYCNIARFDVTGEPPVCVLPGTQTATGELVEVNGVGQIVGHTLGGMRALAIHSGSLASLADSDSDGVADFEDNCTLAANPDQRDTNQDGYGNLCDPDLDDDLVVNFSDLALLKAEFFAFGDLDGDLDGDGVVNFADLAIMKAMFFGPPGPAPIPPVVCGADNMGLDPAEAFDAEMFLRGTAAGAWGAIPDLNNFVNQGNDLYEVELELGPGSYDYKVADADWGIERSNSVDVLMPGGSVTLEDNGGGSPNATMSIPTDGCYEFRLDAADTDFPVLSLDQKF